MKFEFYIDGERKDDYTQTLTTTTESVTKTATITGLTTGSHNCEVRVYDAENNNNQNAKVGTTKLYTWYQYETTWAAEGELTLEKSDIYVTYGNDVRWCDSSRPSFVDASNASNGILLVSNGYKPSGSFKLWDFGSEKWLSFSPLNTSVSSVEGDNKVYYVKEIISGTSGSSIGKVLADYYVIKVKSYRVKASNTPCGTLTGTSRNSYKDGEIVDKMIVYYKGIE